MVAVCLSNLTIQAVVGTPGKTASVKRICQEELPVGLFSSGEVLNEDGLKTFLDAFWRKNALPKKDVVLVLGGSRLVNKVVEAPYPMKQSQTVSYLSREFTDFSRGSDTAFGCWVLDVRKKQKRASLLATGAERSYLRTLSRVFSAAGIKLTDIVSELSGILSMLRDTKELTGKTAIVQYFNGISLTNVLMIGGAYTYSNTNVLPYDSGTPAFAIGVARQIGQILQFMKAQNMNHRIEQVYLAGLSDDDLALCMDSITQMNSTLVVDALPCRDALRQALPTAGALGVQCGEMRLLLQLERDAQTLQERANAKKRFIPVAILAFLAICSCTVTYGIYSYRHSQLLALRNYNNSDLVVNSVAEYDALQAENTMLQKKLRGIEHDRSAIDGYPAPDSGINAILEKCANGLVEIEVSRYSADTGVISTVTTAENVENINYFVAILAQEEIFSDVNYTGYTYNNISDRWSVNVVCTLAPEAGK